VCARACVCVCVCVCVFAQYLRHLKGVCAFGMKTVVCTVRTRARVAHDGGSSTGESMTESCLVSSFLHVWISHFHMLVCPSIARLFVTMHTRRPRGDPHHLTRAQWSGSRQHLTGLR
jgi:hypothetical protein